MTRRRGGAAAAVALAGSVLVACTSTVTGTASPAEPAPTTVPAPQTEPGAPTEPPVEVTPPPRGVGAVLESHRIAGATALIQAVFPDRTTSCQPSGPFTRAADLESAYFVDGTAAVLDRWGFVAGWGQCGAAPDDGPVTIALVMELSDPQSAGRAAEELAAELVTGGFEPAAVPGLDAPALLLTEGGEDFVEVLVPVGRMLAYGFHQGPAGTGLADAGRLMGDQVALLQGFSPTPQADVPDLPTDPLGLAPLTVDPPGAATAYSGPYDLEGYLRLSIDPIRERELLTANGFRGFYTKQSKEGDLSFGVALYAFPSVTETNAVYDAFAQLEAAAFGGTPFVLPAIPQAPCFWFAEGETFYQRCYVGFRSYLASVDVAGLAVADDVARMTELLPAQRDRIDG